MGVEQGRHALRAHDKGSGHVSREARRDEDDASDRRGSHETVWRVGVTRREHLWRRLASVDARHLHRRALLDRRWVQWERFVQDLDARGRASRHSRSVSSRHGQEFNVARFFL